MSNKENEKMKLISFLHFLHGGLIISFINETINGLNAFNSLDSLNSLERNHDWRVGAILLIFFILYITLAFLQIASGYFLIKRTRYKFSFFVAYLECIFTPIGTIIGVFTIILLSKDSVKNFYFKS